METPKLILVVDGDYTEAEGALFEQVRDFAIKLGIDVSAGLIGGRPKGH